MVVLFSTHNHGICFADPQIENYLFVTLHWHTRRFL
jgi:hypothetical protein